MDKTLIDLKQIQLLHDVLKTLKDNDTVSIDNLDEVRLHLRKELGTLSVRLKNIVSRLPAPQVNVPSDLKVDVKNLKNLESLLKSLNAKDYNPTINVSPPDVNIPDIIVPAVQVPPIEVPAPQVTVKPADVNIDIQRIIDALEPLSFISNKASKPISVRLSDGQKFVKALKKMADTAERQVTAFAQSSGISSDEMKAITGTPKTFNHVKITVTSAGTPVQISTTPVACDEVYLSGETDSGVVMVVGGDNTVRATTGNKNGLVIIPGNQPMTIKTNDLKNLWVDSETDGGILCVSYASR